MKSFLIIISSLFIVLSIAIFEQVYIDKSFNEFQNHLEAFEKKIEDDNVTKEDSENLKNFWSKKRNVLFAFIPHADLKQMDMLLAQLSSQTEDSNTDNLRTSVVSLKELSEVIPYSLKVTAGNIF